MPKFQVKKSIEVNAPANKIFNVLSDFNNWPSWSPWLIQEPECKVDVAGDGKSYSWEGARIGSGNMRITQEEANKSLNCDLNFLKPWKSSSKVGFALKPSGDDRTEVTWWMNSSLPFFMFWMKKMMVAFVGMDYTRGLMMLKDVVEDGKAHTKLDFKGRSDYPGCSYIGIKTTCNMETLGPQMSNDLQALGKFMSDQEDQIAGVPFSIYHKWDMVNDRIVYTSGIPIKGGLNDLPTNMFIAEIPATLVYTLKHTGPYKHLGNAWSTLYGMQRSKAFKYNKKIHPFETYTNMPGEVADEELVTEVHFPIK